MAREKRRGKNGEGKTARGKFYGEINLQPKKIAKIEHYANQPQKTQTNIIDENIFILEKLEEK